MHTQFQHLFPTKKRTEQAGGGEGGGELEEKGERGEKESNESAKRRDTGGELRSLSRKYKYEFHEKGCNKQKRNRYKENT